LIAPLEVVEALIIINQMSGVTFKSSVCSSFVSCSVSGALQSRLLVHQQNQASTAKPLFKHWRSSRYVNI
jgi:hypothetical protein